MNEFKVGDVVSVNGKAGKIVETCRYSPKFLVEGVSGSSWHYYAEVSAGEQGKTWWIRYPNCWDVGGGDIDSLFDEGEFYDYMQVPDEHRNVLKVRIRIIEDHKYDHTRAAKEEELKLAEAKVKRLKDELKQ